METIRAMGRVITEIIRVISSEIRGKVREVKLSYEEEK